MKILSYRYNDAACVGAVTANGIVDLGARLKIGSLRELLERNLLREAQVLGSAAADHDLKAIEFLPVVPDPPPLICVGINYRKHLEEVQAPVWRASYQNIPRYSSGSTTRWPRTRRR